MFSYEKEKLEWKLTKDASCMGYSVFLKREFINDLNFEDEQKSQVWMNTLLVQLIQICCLAGCFYYYSYKDGFKIFPAQGLDLVCARFLCSMMMHINVEKDCRTGLAMMKYAVNHRDNFTYVYPPFFIGLFQFIISVFVEINVMFILSAM